MDVTGTLLLLSLAFAHGDALMVSGCTPRPTMFYIGDRSWRGEDRACGRVEKPGGCGGVVEKGEVVCIPTTGSG